MSHSGNFSLGDGTDMTVLGTERVILTREQRVPNCLIENKPIEFYLEPWFHDLINHEPMMLAVPNRSMKASQCFDSVQAETEFVCDWMRLAPSDIASTSVDVDHSSFLNSITPMAMNQKGRDSISRENTKSTSSTEKLKKRKTEYVTAEDCKEKRPEAEAVEEESEITAKSTNAETTAGMSMEDSKVSVIQKPDYIHVRARRGQATDSHSLAERARREKISKKMKCLQDLVPGCNKVAGKAGMLDEIINYVQSLQRQVEFLSMKLAALNPGREINVASVLMKEFPAYSASFPAATAPSEMANAAPLQFYGAQGTANSGVDMPVDPTQITTQRTTSSSSSIPEAYPDLSCLAQVQSLPNWGNDFQTIYNNFY